MTLMKHLIWAAPIVIVGQLVWPAVVEVVQLVLWLIPALPVFAAVASTMWCLAKLKANESAPESKTDARHRI